MTFNFTSLKKYKKSLWNVLLSLKARKRWADPMQDNQMQYLRLKKNQTNCKQRITDYAVQQQFLELFWKRWVVR